MRLDKKEQNDGHHWKICSRIRFGVSKFQESSDVHSSSYVYDIFGSHKEIHSFFRISWNTSSDYWVILSIFQKCLQAEKNQHDASNNDIFLNHYHQLINCGFKIM